MNEILTGGQRIEPNSHFIDCTIYLISKPLTDLKRTMQLMISKNVKEKDKKD